MDVTTYGGRDVGQIPMVIFPLGFKLIFTVIVPVAAVAYIPASALVGHSGIPLWVACAFPLFGVLFLTASFKFWHVGVRHYCLAGSSA